MASDECRSCHEDTSVEVQNVQEVLSGNQMDRLPNIAENDDRGRVVRHLQEHVSFGGCAICK